jgi:transketolase
VGRSGAVVGIASFGESAPAKELYAHFGITTARIAQEVRRLVQSSRAGAVRAEPALAS